MAFYVSCNGIPQKMLALYTSKNEEADQIKLPW